MIASAAVTTGLFVLAGVVVGALVTGGVNYAFEWRRQEARLRVAVRLLESELLIAAAQADWRLEQGEWSPWTVDSARRTWDEYRADIARFPRDDWYAVTRGFFAIDGIERQFSIHAVGNPLDAKERKALNSYSKAITEAANTFRRRDGLEEFARFGGPDDEPTTARQS